MILVDLDDLVRGVLVAIGVAVLAGVCGVVYGILSFHPLW